MKLLLIVKLYDMFCTDTLRHRETARKVVELINKQENRDPVEIDFSKIDFASRSFIHELLCGLGSRKVNFSNANEEVTQMTSIIQKSSVCAHC